MRFVRFGTLRYSQPRLCSLFPMAAPKGFTAMRARTQHPAT